MQSLRGLRVVARSADGERVTPLPTPGDYRVRGSVEACIPRNSHGHFR